jgi:iron complex transport system ATP-binding protein
VDTSLKSGLAARQVTVRAGTRVLVTDLTVEFTPGEVVAILGCNGAGKTLTLHTLAGLRAPQSGSVYLDGVPFESLSRRAIALRLGLLAQDIEDAFVTTVLEMVLIGRHPHLGLWQWESQDDERIAHEALLAVGLVDFAERRTDTLSGGELRRVAIAALLAQQPGSGGAKGSPPPPFNYLLDEPTNHLDPHHQITALTLFREQALKGSTVITTLHDPTLAARFADRVVLLFGDGHWNAGPVSEALTAESLSALYNSTMLEIEKDGRRIFVSA